MLCSAASLPSLLIGAETLLRRSVCAAGRPACPQVSRDIWLSGSDLQCPALTSRSGTSSGVAHDGGRLVALVLVVISELRTTSVYRALLAGPVPVLAPGSQI